MDDVDSEQDEPEKADAEELSDEELEEAAGGSPMHDPTDWPPMPGPGPG
jgi:hypothetical protein